MGIAILLAAATSLFAEPMLDGRCDDHVKATLPETVADGVTAYVQQTRDHVWLCFSLPEGSYGTLDLRIAAPKLSAPLNLHASAQLGEWLADNPAAAPADGSSALWWRGIAGWWASLTPFNGMTTTSAGRQLNFRTVRGREIQLSKARFGRGAWRLTAVLSDVAGGQGQPRKIRWPSEGEITLAVN